MEKQPTVYIMAKSSNATLYTGVTSNLLARTWQHREHIVEAFTQKYDVTKLVWYELDGTMDTAIVRGKQIKKWLRAWKIELMEMQNPYWNDLWLDIAG